MPERFAGGVAIAAGLATSVDWNGEEDRAANECVRRAAAANLVYMRANHQCELLPIFFPGADVKEAAEQTRNAINQHAPWVQLTYVPSAVREDIHLLNRRWYTSYPPCNEPEDGKSCDEYPYFASNQSGPEGFLGNVRTAHLEMVDATHNSAEGGKYGNFVQSCGLTQDDPLLVVPVVDLDLPTAWKC